MPIYPNVTPPTTVHALTAPVPAHVAHPLAFTGSGVGTYLLIGIAILAIVFGLFLWSVTRAIKHTWWD